MVNGFIFDCATGAFGPKAENDPMSWIKTHTVIYIYILCLMKMGLFEPSDLCLWSIFEVHIFHLCYVEIYFII